jgi:hypothetical protein
MGQLPDTDEEITSHRSHQIVSVTLAWTVFILIPVLLVCMDVQVVSVTKTNGILVSFLCQFVVLGSGMTNTGICCTPKFESKVIKVHVLITFSPIYRHPMI